MNKLTVRRTLMFVAITLIACNCRVFSQSPELEVEGEDQTAIVVTIPPSIQSNLEAYTTEEYSFNYPIGYTITLPTQPFPALNIEKARNKRMEIFQMEDFERRPWGFTGDETQEEIDGYVPKETLTLGSGDKQYDVWLYYGENDTQTKKELDAIFESIVIK